MYGSISVEEALKRGDRIIKFPVLFIFVCCLVLFPLLSYFIGVEVYWGMLAGLVLGAALALLYSSYITTRWRIWAFANVADVHELKKAAITEGFISKDGSWQEKLEIRTESDKRAWSELQARFTAPFKFYDDDSIPSETIIYNSRSIAYLVLFFSFAGIVGGTILFLFSHSYLLLAFFIIAACIGFWRFQKLAKIEPQIVLSNEGIKAASTGFSPWADISDEEVEFVQAGKDSKCYLKYKIPAGGERISLELLDVTPRHLNHLLYVYRHRN